VSDDFDSLFDAPVTPADTAPRSTAAYAYQPTPEPEPLPLANTEPEKPFIWLPLYKAGMRVYYKDKPHTVSHVLISKGNLFVHLAEMEGAIPADMVQVEWTRLTVTFSERKPKPALPSPQPQPAAVPAELKPVI
jgi:hypothetical protein